MSEKIGERDRGTHTCTLTLTYTVRYLNGELWGVNWRHWHQACLCLRQQIPAASVIKEDRCVQGRFWEASSFRPSRFCCCSAPWEMTAVTTCVCVCQPTDSRTADSQVKRRSQPVGTFSPYFISCLCPPYLSIDLWIKGSTEEWWAWSTERWWREIKKDL